MTAAKASEPALPALPPNGVSTGGREEEAEESAAFMTSWVSLLREECDEIMGNISENHKKRAPEPQPKGSPHSPCAESRAESEQINELTKPHSWNAAAKR
ncbi:hypothetical protein GCM10023213_46940 [Prosthecobacter algae]|uniref:Uncharacterized protein n=1 Tax=Prosthecobacter algae TaxID=1144682 RepID=A0ABP9PT51_9BACT